MKRITGCRMALCAVLGALLLGVGCTGASKAPGGAQIDTAIALFVMGKYEQAIERLSELAQSLDSDEALREVYYYLGRAYLAAGEHDRAIEAFGAGVSYGDGGACVDYLEQLKAYIETGQRGIRRSETLSRRQLASAMARVVWDPEATPPAAAPDDPDAALRAVVERGWMRALPDGGLHADATVTRSAFYVTISRMARDLGLGSGLLTDARGLVSVRGSEPISGAEAMSLLEEFSELRKQRNGR